jgi:hypothetical protein
VVAATLHSGAHNPDGSLDPTFRRRREGADRPGGVVFRELPFEGRGELVSGTVERRNAEPQAEPHLDGIFVALEEAGDLLPVRDRPVIWEWVGG